jgi:hypothetical protein
VFGRHGLPREIEDSGLGWFAAGGRVGGQYCTGGSLPAFSDAVNGWASISLDHRAFRTLEFASLGITGRLIAM